jgi:hypothetical protein
VVADDSIAHLRELLNESSLEGVFTKFTGGEGGHRLAEGILAVMRS